MKTTQSLEEALFAVYGSRRTITGRRMVTGGDINEACALALDDGSTLFMKSNTARSLPVLEAEAAGLETIRKTHAIGTPRVLGIGTDRGTSFLLLEYISGSRPTGH